ncbi:MAG: nicotinamidase/pyrazinamidase [Xanthobacteraceae bacterium]|nr:MAG: nicotinamidase/pyrazinamidase [Xanthobacteraceae bacterium]
MNDRFSLDRRAMIAGATLLTATASRGVQAQDRPVIDQQTALIVVDVQNDFCPGGRLAVPKGDDVVAVCNAIGKRFQNVVLTQDWHPEGHSSFASSHAGKKPFEVVQMPYGPQVLWPDHCTWDSAGAEFHEGLDIPHAQTIVRKGYRKEVDSYSGFLEADRKTATGLGGYLRERGVTPISASTGWRRTPPRTACRPLSSRRPAAPSTSAARSTRPGPTWRRSG